MRPLTQEWIDKAEEDWESLGVLFRARKIQHNNAACFHAQQCAEKYLKARLVEAGRSFPKTHDLADVLALVLPIEPHWHIFLPALQMLTPYGVLYRYPGFTATREEAKKARKHCETVRAAVRLTLGLP